MRILFTSYPLHGHVNPMLPLAVAAGRAGHEVAFATGADMAFVLQQWGLDVWPVGPTHADVAASMPPSPRYFTESATQRARDLVPRAAEWAPDLIVADEFELAGPVAAATSGARLVIHGLGLMIPFPIWASLESEVAALHEGWGVDAGAARVRAAPYLELAPPALRPGGERIWETTQPLRPSPGPAAAGEQLPAAFDALPYPDTIHLTLGTLFHERPEVLETAIDGLRELDANLVVTSGPGADTTRFGPQPDHVLIEPYLPHSLLLPRCRLVVSQGGAGIMFGALSHGLPHLMLPQGADQFMNADACTRAGAALAIGPDDFTATAVAEAAKRLLNEPGFAEAAGTISAEINAMPAAEEVLAGLVS